MRTRNTDTLPHEKDSDAVREICTLLAGISDENLIHDFFGCLFTSAELKDFANRWHLVKELDAGTTQREIAKNIICHFVILQEVLESLKRKTLLFAGYWKFLKKSQKNSAEDLLKK